MREYERYYEISLLDDLHNYFPDILYNSSRFQTVQDLIQYIQNETRNRFDLFSSALRRNRTTTSNQETSRSTSSTNSRVSQLVGRRTGYSIPEASSIRVVAPQDQISLTFNINDDLPAQPVVGDDIEIMSSILNVLNSLGGSNLSRVISRENLLNRQNSFTEPVTVRPTQEQINAATTLIEIANSTELCAICQDSIVNELQQVRRINHCQHMFHNNCISQWFNRNVRCPTCRYDIRT
jgi:hypothetical protein